MTSDGGVSNFQWQTFKTSEGQVRCLVGGSGPPLIYEHAASGPRISHGLELLTAHRTIYIPVLPGFEHSDPLPAESGVPRLAHWLAGLIDSTFDGPVDVAGHSFGGWVTCWLCVNRPELVGTLSLVSPAGFAAGGGGNLEGDADSLLQRSYAHPERRPAESRSPEVIAANRVAAATYSGGTIYDSALVARLGGIRAQVLILYGVKDGVIPPSCPELLTDNIVNSTVAYVDDAAHNVDIDQPEDFAAAVELHLAKHSQISEPPL